MQSLMDYPKDRRLTLALCGMLAAVTFVAFSSVIRADFVEYDDQDYVTENPQVQAGLTWHGIGWAFAAAHSANWIPLTWMSHMLDCQWYGLHAGCHHLTNLMLHIASTVLLFLVLKRVTSAIWPSALVAVLFAVHPLHVESVAWVSERKDVLSGFFFMLTLWAYVGYVEKSKVQSPKSKAQTALYWLSVLFFALGLLSKPMLVTLPFVLLLLDFWPLERLQSGINDSREDAQTQDKASRRIKSASLPLKDFLHLLREKAPFFALAFMSSLITFYTQKQGGAMVLMESIPLNGRLANAAMSYCRYLLNTFWPVDLAAFYPMPAAWPTWQVGLAVLMLCVVTVLALSQSQKRPYIAVGWFWFLGTLVPVIGVVQIGTQSMADRYTYLPLVGIFIMVAFGIREWLERQPEWRLGLGIAVTVVVALCALLTANQAGYWRDTATLFEHALAVTSDNAVAEYSLGVVQVRQGNYPEAYSHFTDALRIKPDYGEAHNNLGLLLVMNGKLDEGIEHYRAALQANTDTPELRFNLASALLQKGETEAAAAELRTALKASPSFSAAHLKLAMILGKQGKSAEARGEYAAVLQEEPGNSEAHLGLGLLLIQTGQLDEANKQLEEVLRLHPDARAHHNLALVLSLQGHSDQALKHYRAAVKLEPTWPVALNDLAWVLATDPNPTHRDGAQSVELAQKAWELSDRKEARYLGTLDACYAEAGRFEEAIATARQAEALASSCGQKQIAEAAAARRKLYEAKQPYREARSTF